jgi:hypothetical protein
MACSFEGIETTVFIYQTFMKKITLLGILIVSMLTACQKDNDPGPGERPEDRVNQALTEYKATLVSAQHGWKAVLHPDGGAGYSFHFIFSENDRVTMLSDINATTIAEPFQSSFRLKALQRPSLIFDTYSYLHILSDPDATKSGGDWGQGKYSDFEFLFDSVTPETITLTGSLKGSKLILTKATREEAENYIKRIGEQANAFRNIDKLTTYFKRFTVGTSTFDISADTERRLITFSYYEGDTRRSFETSYYFTQEGLTLIDPFVSGPLTVTTLTGLQHIASTNRINFQINGASASVQESIRPARIDVEAARQFTRISENDYLLSGSGFTVNGVIDAFKLRTIPNFYFLIYWPKFGNSNGTVYDLLGIVLYNRTENRPEIGYGPIGAPRLTADGRVVFTHLGSLGEVPEQFVPIITATREQWTEPQGFYVIPTGRDSYDLVSAKDARAWISLE